LRAIHAVVGPVVRELRPQALVTQHGCDTHVLDPLAHLRVSVDGQREAAVLLHDVAHEHAEGAGWPSAAAATSWSTWSRGRGPTWSVSRRTPRSTR
jgi:hypothetical protein